MIVFSVNISQLKRIVLKGGVAELGALKILALPKKGGGSDLCQDFLVDL